MLPSTLLHRPRAAPRAGSPRRQPIRRATTPPCASTPRPPGAAVPGQHAQGHERRLGLPSNTLSARKSSRSSTRRGRTTHWPPTSGLPCRRQVRETTSSSTSSASWSTQSSTAAPQAASAHSSARLRWPTSLASTCVDGEGYRLLTDFATDLDPANRQIAHRLMQAMILWWQFDATRQTLVQEHLTRVLPSDFGCDNTYEVLWRTIDYLLPMQRRGQKTMHTPLRVSRGASKTIRVRVCVITRGRKGRANVLQAPTLLIPTTPSARKPDAAFRHDRKPNDRA